MGKYTVQNIDTSVETATDRQAWSDCSCHHPRDHVRRNVPSQWAWMIEEMSASCEWRNMAEVKQLVKADGQLRNAIQIHVETC